MCGPTPIGIAIGAISVGKAVAGHKAQNDQEKANAEAARASFRQQIGDINLVQAELREQTSRSIFDTERQIMSSLALERVSQGEAGIAGISAEEVRADIIGDGAEATIRAQRQEDRQIRSLERQKDSARVLRDNRIAGVPGANPFLTGIRIAGSALQAGSSIHNSGPIAETR